MLPQNFYFKMFRLVVQINFQYILLVCKSEILRFGLILVFRCRPIWYVLFQKKNNDLSDKSMHSGKNLGVSYN